MIFFLLASVTDRCCASDDVDNITHKHLETLHSMVMLHRQAKTTKMTLGNSFQKIFELFLTSRLSHCKATILNEIQLCHHLIKWKNISMKYYII